ncbi:cytoplasmic protein [Desulfuribacillus stibiiarsenatis]|uniref:Cytoplasmic protein n=1 Tax=Desulfuribacillus stibiiarsenatis TaxID=1390249 RepID=A0A1E5L3V3_9FIRM|nr:metal-sensing transcriptional repressor [Desulfuribacillus stibiiarsenatis]OEH84828.1 cytoplasmic protein [Desulfuribacillus stibiiarsenatis]
MNRIKRIEGQAKGIHKMMEEGRSCKEVIHQLSAIRSATDKLIVNIVAENIEYCVLQDIEQGNDIKDTMQQAIELLIKSR